MDLKWDIGIPLKIPSSSFSLEVESKNSRRIGFKGAQNTMGEWPWGFFGDLNMDWDTGISFCICPSRITQSLALNQEIKLGDGGHNWTFGEGIENTKGDFIGSLPGKFVQGNKNW